jgi:hypothetical protein
MTRFSPPLPLQLLAMVYCSSWLLPNSFLFFIHKSSSHSKVCSLRCWHHHELKNEYWIILEVLTVVVMKSYIFCSIIMWSIGSHVTCRGTPHPKCQSTLNGLFSVMCKKIEPFNESYVLISYISDSAIECSDQLKLIWVWGGVDIYKMWFH